MNINLPYDTTELLEGLVASGQYASREEAIAAGLLLLMKQQQLKADIHQGISELDTGQGIDGAIVFAELRERAKILKEQTN